MQIFSCGAGPTTGDQDKSLEDSSSHEHQYESAESSSKPSSYEPLNTLNTRALQSKTARENNTRGRGSDDYELPTNCDHSIHLLCQGGPI